MSIHCPVADNVPESLETARQVLDRQGISVTGVAASSAEAIARADLQADAVLTDVHLGEGSGFLLASRIAALDQAGSPRVMVISASPKHDVGEALSAGSMVEFVSETGLSATAIRTALGLTPDEETAGREQMRAMSRPHVRRDQRRVVRHNRRVAPERQASSATVPSVQSARTRCGRPRRESAACLVRVPAGQEVATCPG
jgi:CheY-like chemotaxis protein